MITDKGKNILAKYLVGHAPSYASFIALGIGPRPLGMMDEPEDYRGKQNLDFEALRIPISSRGYVYDENNNLNIVFAGELPSEQRYEFSEIGVFSAKANPLAGSLGSRNIYTFSESENWEYHDANLATGIPTRLEPLYGEGDQSIIFVGDVAFRTNPDNALFSSSEIRGQIYERSRFLDRAMIIRGDMSTLENVDGRILVKENSGSEFNSSHIHLAGVTPNLDRNSSQDELRLAFSVINKLDTQGQTVDNVKILIEFASTDAVNPDNFARMEVEESISNENRYFVVRSKLEDLSKSPNFTWSNVNVAKIYLSVYETSESGPILSDNFYVLLDGLRFENLTSTTPLYGMTAYQVVRNADKKTIVKESNSSNLVEFRFGLEAFDA